jgi:hypothetical protein
MNNDEIDMNDLFDDVWSRCKTKEDKKIVSLARAKHDQYEMACNSFDFLAMVSLFEEVMCLSQKCIQIYDKESDG